MKYILLELLAYDCGQEYELDDYEVLINIDDNAEDNIKSVIEEYLLNFYDIEELPISTEYQLSQFKLVNNATAYFDVDGTYHNLEYMEMVHIEVSWKYVEVFDRQVMGIVL